MRCAQHEWGVDRLGQPEEGMSPASATCLCERRTSFLLRIHCAHLVAFVHCPPACLPAVHGDLKPGNVLLKTHKVDRRGYIAKVSDFGLSRPLDCDDTHAT